MDGLAAPDGRDRLPHLLGREALGHLQGQEVVAQHALVGERREQLAEARAGQQV